VYFKSRLRIITVKMPDLYLEGIGKLVKNRSEVIRAAVRELLRRELWMKEVELM